MVTGALVVFKVIKLVACVVNGVCGLFVVGRVGLVGLEGLVGLVGLVGLSENVDVVFSVVAFIVIKGGFIVVVRVVSVIDGVMKGILVFVGNFVGLVGRMMVGLLGTSVVPALVEGVLCTTETLSVVLSTGEVVGL